MKYYLYIAFIATGLLLSSCSSLRSGGDGYGITATEINTYTEAIERLDLDVDAQGITHTVDITTAEGRFKLKGLNLEQAQRMVLDDAAIKNHCARIVSPKFSPLLKGRKILSITVFGFPARYKNSEKTATPDKEPKKDNVIIVK